MVHRDRVRAECEKSKCQLVTSTKNLVHVAHLIFFPNLFPHHQMMARPVLSFVMVLDAAILRHLLSILPRVSVRCPFAAVAAARCAVIYNDLPQSSALSRHCTARTECAVFYFGGNGASHSATVRRKSSELIDHQLSPSLTIRSASPPPSVTADIAV